MEGTWVGMFTYYGVLPSIKSTGEQSFVSCREPTIEELKDASGFSRATLQRLLRLRASREVFSGATRKGLKGGGSGNALPVRTDTLRHVMCPGLAEDSSNDVWSLHVWRVAFAVSVQFSMPPELGLEGVDGDTLSLVKQIWQMFV